jgi:hypothetical protein
MLVNNMKDGKMPKVVKVANEQKSWLQHGRQSRSRLAIREAIMQINEELNKDGKNSLGQTWTSCRKEMEKTETELVNKQLTAEMLKRQQQILTRLLEAENAERQRETDNKRESNSAKGHGEANASGN